ncbi:Internalin-A [Kordia antarctica]|uniref:Internalin-A n=1 Tax=Kordia antarctica TaxID=1218801 RepID=A0A7L4ZF87_9FLAO|nr:leucine-rich repeat domain-containing protein [Kordia antarctica]QHI35177.1 Internalin-A [Kordia antarctica]
MSKEINPSDFENELEYVEAVTGINVPTKDYELNKDGKLITLNLSNNRISNIDFLTNLTSLEILDLSENKISNIDALKNLTSLTALNLYQNDISDISALSKLTSLTGLYLSDNQISDLKPLSKLTSLTIMNLDNTQIRDLNPLSELTSLIDLSLQENQISDLNPISKLTSLTELYLSSNQISNLKSLPKLTSLTYLDLSSNLISKLNPLSELKFLKTIYIDNNPCTVNENLELLENHIDFLNLWLAKNKLEDKISVLMPKKVVFLGNHASGKSSLLHYLQKETYALHTDTTHVLNVTQHKLKPTESTYVKSLFENKEKIKEILPLMYYDFGGQDFYHGLYQSFSSKTAFQIVVYCANQTEISLGEDTNGYDTYTYPLSFWLKEKEYLEKGTKNPYFIVENKIDEKVTSAFAKDYPIVCDFDAPNGIFHVFLKKLVPVNVIKENNNRLQLEYLKKQLLQELYESQVVSERVIDFYKKVYAESIEAGLKIEKRSSYTIEGISAENMLTQLQLLENSGVLFLSEDKTQVIANPKAFITHIHENILKQDSILKKEGKISFEDWKAIKKGKHAKLIESFMLKQKTMFIDTYAEAYVFPNYLPLYTQDEERYFLNVSAQHMAFSIQLQYFVPFGFINVLIHHFGKEPNKKKFWRDAIYFIQHEDEKPKANVFIVVNIPKLCLDVSVESRDTTFNVQKYKRYLWLCLSKMYHQQPLISWEDFKKEKTTSKDEIEKHLEEKALLKHNEFPETAKVSIDGKYYALLSTLKNRIDTNEYNIQVTNEQGRSKLLPLYQFQVFTEKSIKRMKKVAISYSKDDLALVNEFIKSLVPLQDDGLIESPVWYCTDLKPGTEWDKEIQENFETADMIFFMVSPNFLATNYIKEHEIKTAIQKRTKQLNANKPVGEQLKIIPIILDHCSWVRKDQTMNLGQYNALPYTAKPVLDFDNINKAWYLTTESIRIAIEHDNDSSFRLDSSKEIQKLRERLIAGYLDKNSK